MRKALFLSRALAGSMNYSPDGTAGGTVAAKTPATPRRARRTSRTGAGQQSAAPTRSSPLDVDARERQCRETHADTPRPSRTRVYYADSSDRDIEAVHDDAPDDPGGFVSVVRLKEGSCVVTRRLMLSAKPAVSPRTEATISLSWEVDANLSAVVVSAQQSHPKTLLWRPSTRECRERSGHSDPGGETRELIGY